MKKLLCCLSSLSLATFVASAQEVTWTGGDGYFEDTGNWSTGEMPVSTNTPVFNRPGPFTISFRQSASTYPLKIRTDNGPIELDFHLNGCHWNCNDHSGFSIKGSNSGTVIFRGAELRNVKGASFGDSSEDIEVVFAGEGSGLIETISKYYQQGDTSRGYSSDGDIGVGGHGNGNTLKVLDGARVHCSRGLILGSDWENWDSNNNLVLVSGTGTVFRTEPYPIKEESGKKWGCEHGNNRLPNGGSNNNLIVENGASFLGGGKKYGTEQSDGGGTIIGVTEANDNMVIVRNGGIFKLGESGSRLIVGYYDAWNNGLLVTSNSTAQIGDTALGFCHNTSNNWITIADGSALKVSGVLYIGGTEADKAGKNCDKTYNGDARYNIFTVTGEGSVCTNNGNIYIGWRGAENVLNVSTGATLVAKSRISLGQAAATANANVLNIVGEGATIHATGNQAKYTLGIGRYGVSNLVYVADGGFLDLTNTFAKPLYVGLGHDAVSHSGNADNKLYINNGSVAAGDLVLTNASHFVMQGGSSSARFSNMIVGGDTTLEFLFDETGIGTVTLDGSLKLVDTACGDAANCGLSDIFIDAKAFIDAGRYGTFTLIRSANDSASDFASDSEILSRIRVRPGYIRPVLDLSKSSLSVAVPLQQTLILIR